MKKLLRVCGWCLPAAVALLLATGVSAAEPVVEQNIVYGKGGGLELKLDLARPADGSGPFPAIVYIHGGGWRGGNREGYRKEIEESARRGYVAVTVSYRLTDPDDKGQPKNPFPAQVHDVKCAVRWLRANADKYHVNPNRIGATGASAGGHLSLMLAVTDDMAGLEGDGGHASVSSRVQAIVNYCGPTDMAHIHATSPQAAPIVATFLNGPPDKAADNYKAASPISYLTKDDPPMLTIHGAADTLVPPDQAWLFDAKARSVGASHSLLLLGGEGHGFKEAAGKQARDATFEFFDKHLKKGRQQAAGSRQ